MQPYSVRFEEADLFGLEGVERQAAISGLMAGKELPFAVVGSELACWGLLDAVAIASAVERQMERSRVRSADAEEARPDR